MIVRDPGPVGMLIILQFVFSSVYVRSVILGMFIDGYRYSIR